MPAPGYEIGRKNRERVRKFFATHLCATNRECAAALGMSVEAVGRHVAVIRAEWCATPNEHILLATAKAG